MNQQSLFNLDAIPEAAPVKPSQKPRWYISGTRSNGTEMVLVATHGDGSSDWREVGTFKHAPHLYKTYAGAKRMAREYASGAVVKEWKGW